MTKTAIAIAIAMPQGKTISRKEKRKKLKDEQDGQCQSIPNSTSGHHHRLILSVITGHWANNEISKLSWIAIINIGYNLANLKQLKATQKLSPSDVLHNILALTHCS